MGCSVACPPLSRSCMKDKCVHMGMLPACARRKSIRACLSACFCAPIPHIGSISWLIATKRMFLHVFHKYSDPGRSLFPRLLR